MSQGPLYLVAISKLGESDSQLRVQLEALYMQILSTLTLPVLSQLFSNRPSTDLRRPLQGTEPLLSALADTFTRGSSSTLLSALECLRIRKTHRQVINSTLLQKRCESLLYGLIVAGGRLVSVVRPRRHSLHPSDLQLIFNMLFEAEGVKAGGGENWIPLCLPGFNKNGFLYMYVSFIQLGDMDKLGGNHGSDLLGEKDEVAVLLISTKKDSFYELRDMRDAVIEVCTASQISFNCYLIMPRTSNPTAACMSSLPLLLVDAHQPQILYQGPSYDTFSTSRELMCSLSCLPTTLTSVQR